MSESNRTEREVAAKKWINEQESDSDQEVGLVPHNQQQFGGNKLRAPKSLSEETELTKSGILSPIESPVDIVQRPTLRRILKSKQIDALAGTAMEFIESEKNFNKILCRLSSILHQDDPQYLDLNFDNLDKNDDENNDDLISPKKEDATASSNSNELTEKSESTTIAKEHNQTDISTTTEVTIKKENNESDNTDALEVLRHVKELLLENINYSNEYLSRLQGARDKLTKARLQKDALYSELRSQLTERRPSNTQRRRQ
ncbi:unnamed protein product [Cunninghamella blakesleeana]